jgi:hypothetical protein
MFVKRKISKVSYEEGKGNKKLSTSYFHNKVNLYSIYSLQDLELNEDDFNIEDCKSATNNKLLLLFLEKICSYNNKIDSFHIESLISGKLISFVLRIR